MKKALAILTALLFVSPAFAGYKGENLYNDYDALVVDASGTTVPVDIASGSVSVSGTVTVNASLGTAAAVTSVNDTNVSGTLLAANANRRQATIVNDSTAVLYALLGSGTASATNYTYRLDQYDAAIVNSYSGQINGIWASDASGAARLTEVT